MSARVELGQWAKVELFGHVTIVGRVRASLGMLAPNFLVVEVPAVEGIEAFAQYVNHAAIYRVTPLAEDVAMAMVHHLRAVPYEYGDLPRAILPDMHDRDADLPF